MSSKLDDILARINDLSHSLRKKEKEEEGGIPSVIIWALVVIGVVAVVAAVAYAVYRYLTPDYLEEFDDDFDDDGDDEFFEDEEEVDQEEDSDSNN